MKIPTLVLSLCNKREVIAAWVGNELDVVAKLLQTQRDVIAASSWFGVPICAILAVGITWCFYFFENYSGGGEPFSLFDGTSAWPSIAIVLFAALLSIYFTYKTHVDLKRNGAKLTEHFSLEGLEKDKENTPLFAWEFPMSKPGSTDIEKEIDIVPLWRRYLRLGRFRSRISRSAPMAVLYIATLIVILPLLGNFPSAPIRGDFYFPVLICLTIVGFLVLTFIVIDAILLHEGFLKQLAEKDTHWPDDTFVNFNYSLETRPIHERDLADYWDILLIARRTKAVGDQIYYPFLILSLLIVARLNYFDNWTWSRALIVVFCLHFSLAIYAAWRLPKVAKEYRDKVLERLRRRRRQVLMRKRRTSEAIETMIEEVQSTHQGAFSYLWEQPAIRALLLPSGGIGLVTLLQYLPH